MNGLNFHLSRHEGNNFGRNCGFESMQKQGALFGKLLSLKVLYRMFDGDDNPQESDLVAVRDVLV